MNPPGLKRGLGTQEYIIPEPEQNFGIWVGLGLGVFSRVFSGWVPIFELAFWLEKSQEKLLARFSGL